MLKIVIEVKNKSYEEKKLRDFMIKFNPIKRNLIISHKFLISHILTN